MKAALLDVNVLLALAWPTHEHHAKSHAWIAAQRRRPWATCSLTQLGFVRLSCNPRVMDHALSAQQAATLLKRMLARRAHVFWADDLDATARSGWPPSWVQGYRQLSDAHLVLLAERYRGRVATFDRGLHAAAGDRAVELIT